MWFGKPLTAEQSNMGKFERVYRKDADGIKKPSFLKAVYNEENPDQIDEMVPTFEDTGDPHLV